LKCCAGIQITWITTVAFNANNSLNSSAQYSIDNGTLFPIQVAAHNSTVQTYDLVSFQTPKLSPGPHHLFVQYGPANDSSAPLVLDHLVIQNLTIPPFTPTPPSPTSSISSTSPGSAASAHIPTSTQTHYQKRLSKGAIGGAVIGSLIGAVIIFILVICYIKRKRASTQPGYAAYPDYGDGQR
jgi:hypothetical protein